MANISLGFIKTDGSSLVLGEDFIMSFDTLSQCNTNGQNISYGILASSGSVSIRDYNDEIANHIKSGDILSDGQKVKVILNGNVIQTHITSDGDYDSVNKELSLKLTDIISAFDNITYPGLEWDGSAMTAYELLTDVMTKLGYTTTEIDNSLTDQMVYGDSYVTIKECLQDITVPYAYLEKDTYRNTLNKICTLAQLQMYFDPNYNPKFLSARPLFISKTNAIKIPEYTMLSYPEESLFVKNIHDKCIVDTDITTEIWDSIYTSDTINITTGGSKSGTGGYGLSCDDESYSLSVYGPELVYTGSVSCEINLKDINYQFIKDISTMKLVVKRSGADIHIQSTKILTTYYNQRTSYTRNDEVEPTISSFYIEDNILHIAFSIIIATSIELIPEGGEVSYYEGSSFQFYVKANRLSVDNQSLTYGSGSNEVEISGNELLQSNELSENIGESVISDYVKGCPTAKFDLICSDFYNESGDKVIDWGKGGVIQVGQLLNYKDSYWFVHSREISFDGYPKQTIDCLRVKVHNPKYGLFDSNGDVIESWDSLINTGKITLSNNSITAANITDSGELKIAENITSIADNVFKNNTYLTSVSTPSTLATFGASCFYGCTSLTDVVIKCTNPLTVGSAAFYNCKALTAVYYAGSGNEWIENNFSSDISNPVYYAHNLYVNCNYKTGDLLTDITINTTELKTAVFTYATCLKTVTLGENVSIINSGSIYKCSLDKLYILNTSTMSFLGNNVSATNNLYYAGTANQWASNTFANGNATPANGANLYLKNGDTYSFISTIELSIETVNEYCFYGAKVNFLKLKSGCVNVKYGAFMNSITALEELASTVKYIEKAFTSYNSSTGWGLIAAYIGEESYSGWRMKYKTASSSDWTDVEVNMQQCSESGGSTDLTKAKSNAGVLTSSLLGTSASGYLYKS